MNAELNTEQNIGEKDFVEYWLPQNAPIAQYNTTKTHTGHLFEWFI